MKSVIRSMTLERRASPYTPAPQTPQPQEVCPTCGKPA